jgi:hypothetical protein
MSIQALALINGSGSSGSVSVLGAEVGDKVVSIQILQNNGAYTFGQDISSFFETSISVAGQIQQLQGLQNNGAEVIALLARGV